MNHHKQQPDNSNGSKSNNNNYHKTNDHGNDDDNGDHSRGEVINSPSDHSDPHSTQFQRSSKKFRFKKYPSSRHAHVKRQHSPDHAGDGGDDTTHRIHNPDHRHRHHHRRRHRHHHHYHHHDDHRSSTKTGWPNNQDRHQTPSPSRYRHRHSDEQEMSPETAFRESLFDAMADDEGAAFWEGVYGQPIHNYTAPNVPKGPNGELERMSDEEYAAYVRAMMWERTQEGMREARERLREQKRKMGEMGEEDVRKQSEERVKFEQAMEDVLRKGEERRKARAWKKAWDDYRKAWDELAAKAANATNTATATASASVSTSTGRSGDGSGKANKDFRSSIFWPVLTGRRLDVNRDAVAEFMRHVPLGTDSKIAHSSHNLSAQATNFTSVLRTERVRWHPDKMLHRYSSLGVDESALKSITAVFQIIDDLWSQEKEREK